MSYRDFDAIQEITDVRFPKVSFTLSCFDSIEDIAYKPVSYFHDTIIIAYQYRPEYYENLDIELQDVDYIIVRKQEGALCIRYCDVIDAIIGSELTGDIKPCHHLYLEGIVRVENDTNRIPMYRIQWGN